jgi:hypothetical protein
MLNSQQVFNRVRKLAAFRDMNESDFREAVYCQTFTPAAGATTAFTPRPFPNGAIILGITASAYVPGVGPTFQTAKNRQLFKLDFSYTGGEAIVIDGPVLADALLGGGDENHFPSKELVISPGQQINCRVQNITDGALTVEVVYHCLVYRFAA